MVTLDNFGIFLAGHFKAVSNVATLVTLKDIAGLDRVIRIYGSSSQDVWCDSDEGTVSDFAQVGKGTTPATRQDVNIEDPFPDAPENSRRSSIVAGYNSGLGKITISTVITPTGGSGSVTEIVKIQGMIGANNTITGFHTFFRDNISPVGFIIGETINVSYEVLI